MAELSGWTVIALRPADQQAALRRTIEARGARALALPALRLGAAPDADAARRALRRALAATRVLFTSPAAVRFAARLVPLRAHAGRPVHAVGTGTARALARHGLHAIHPAAGLMHSEGVLALPDFAPGALAGHTVGLVTAPGGRGVLKQVLAERGAALRVAEVYARLPPRLDRRHAEALRASSAPRAVLVTSAEALGHALAQLPADAAASLRDSVAIASSARLAEMARARGFAATLDAGSPQPAAMLDALAAAARAGAWKTQPFR